MYKKLSEAMKKAHCEGRHPGWSHINLDKNRRSYPEKFVLKVLENNKILNKYHVIEKLPIGKYILDFAIIDLKLNIEVDGEQHYRDNKAIQHDKTRNIFLSNNGWKIYRINWKTFNANKKDNIELLINYIDNIENETDCFYELSNIVIKKQSKYGTQEKYFNAIKAKNEIKQQKYVKAVLNSNINFTKFGWVKLVAKIINQKPQRVNRWMKRFLPEHYNKKCYKRNAPVSPLATN